MGSTTQHRSPPTCRSPRQDPSLPAQYYAPDEACTPQKASSTPRAADPAAIRPATPPPSAARASNRHSRVSKQATLPSAVRTSGSILDHCNCQSGTSSSDAISHPGPSSSGVGSCRSRSLSPDPSKLPSNLCSATPSNIWNASSGPIASASRLSSQICRYVPYRSNRSATERGACASFEDSYHRRRSSRAEFQTAPHSWSSSSPRTLRAVVQRQRISVNTARGWRRAPGSSLRGRALRSLRSRTSLLSSKQAQKQRRPHSTFVDLRLRYRPGTHAGPVSCSLVDEAHASESLVIWRAM
jgi:hypothetical protein